MRKCVFFVIVSLIFFFNSLFCQNSKIDSLIEIINSKSNYKEISNIYLDLSNEYVSISNIKTVYYLNLGIKHSKLEKNDFNIARANRIYGKYYLSINKLDSSIIKFTESLKLFKEIGNEVEIAATLANIGTIYYNQGDYEKALDIYLDANKLFSKNSDLKGMSFIYNNIGMIYLNQNKYNEAINNFEQSLSIKENIKDEIGIAHTLCNLGNTFSNIGNNLKAISMMLKALEIFQYNDLKYEIALTCYNIGDFYKRENDLEKAKIYYFQSLQFSQKIKANEIQWKVFKELSNVYVKEGNFKLALKHFQQYSNLKDSIIIEENKSITKELQIKFETERKEHRIKQLDNENKLNIEKLKNNNIILRFSFIFIFTLIILTLFLLIQRKKLKEIYKVLLRKNFELVESFKKNETKYLLNIDSYINKETQNDDLKFRLINLIEKEKIFTEKDLTVYKLADYLESNKTYISKIINDEFHQNFNLFINSFRVREAIKLISEGYQKNYKIASIAEKVGFKSLSVFNKAFKDITGLTPSRFIKLSESKSKE